MQQLLRMIKAWSLKQSHVLCFLYVLWIETRGTTVREIQACILGGKLDLHDYSSVIICGAHKPAEHEIKSHKDSVN